MPKKKHLQARYESLDKVSPDKHIKDTLKNTCDIFHYGVEKKIEIKHFY